MRPVNLIPGDRRRGRATGAERRASEIAVWGLLATLAFGVLAVSVLVLTSNRINDKKASVAKLDRETESARAAADALRPYGQFAEMQNARIATIRSLVDTSFNWERVVRALARTIPSDVWLVSFKGTVRPDVEVESQGGGGGASSSGLRGSSQAPAFELVGCTYSHRDVARMMTRMRNIDGVTDVALGSSERPEQQAQQGAGAEAGPGGGGATEDCRTKYSITKFEIVVVLADLTPAAPVAPAAPGAETASASPVASAQAATATGAGAGR